eukprot:2156939-Rhodomonas_salina.2
MPLRVRLFACVRVFSRLTPPRARLLAPGGGKSHAIWFDAAFENGVSGPCETFNSPALSGNGNEQPWRVLHMEAWGLSF